MLRSVIRTPLNPVLRGPLDVLGSGGGGGGAEPIDADAQAVIDAMTTTPSAARQTSINSFVKQLKTGPTNGTNAWAELDALWVLAAADSQAALLNWKDPTGTAATVVGSPTFTADLGYTGNGSSHIETNWDPATDGVNFTQNSSCLGCWVHQVPGTFDGVMGARETPSAHISEIYHGNNIWDFCGSSTDGSGTPVWLQGPSASATGLVAADRDSSTTMALYEGGSQTDTATTASSAIWSGTFHLLGIREGGSAAYRGTAGLSMAFVSGSMSANQHADLEAAFNNYRTGL